MKFTTIIILSCIVAFALAVGSVTVVSTSPDTITVAIAANTATTSNYDFTLTFNDATTFAQNAVHTFICADTEASDYALTADKASMTAFAAEALCTSASCSTTFVDTTTTWYKGTVSYTHTNTTYASAALVAVTSPTLTSTGASGVNTVVSSNISSSDLGLLGLPTSGNTAYLSCWGEIAKSATVDYTAIKTNLTSTFSTPVTVTLGHSAGFTGVVAALTAAGSMALLSAF